METPKLGCRVGTEDKRQSGTGGAYSRREGSGGPGLLNRRLTRRKSGISRYPRQQRVWLFKTNTSPRQACLSRCSPPTDSAMATSGKVLYFLLCSIVPLTKTQPPRRYSHEKKNNAVFLSPLLALGLLVAGSPSLFWLRVETLRLSKSPLTPPPIWHPPITKVMLMWSAHVSVSLCRFSCL